MNKRNKKTSLTILSWMGLVSAILLVVLSAASVSAIEIVDRPVWQNTIEAQGSFNHARRSVFRDLYGNGVTFAIMYERMLNNKLGLGVRASRVQLCKAEDYDIQKLKYRDLAVAPVLTYSLLNNRSLRLFSGLGAGLSFRKITLDTYSINEFGDPETPLTFHQRETTLYGLAMIGANLRLSGSMFVGARAMYDRHFFGDAASGSFGDTGGFNFGGSFGFGF